MSRFVDRAKTDVITMSNGDKVEVRQRLSAAERAELNRNIVHMEYSIKSGEMRVTEGEWYRQKIEVLRAFIVDWDFKDDAGQTIPYKAALVEDLDEETVDEIADAIDKFQANRRDMAEKKGLPPST